MDLKTRKVDNVIVVYLHGKLDVHVSADVEKEINRIIEQEPQCNLLLNLGQVEYMSSSGIGLLVTLLIRAQRQQKRLLACGLDDHYRHIFELTRLNEAISLHPDEASALAAAAGRFSYPPSPGRYLSDGAGVISDGRAASVTKT
mgnify:CR=1 FL=1